MDGDVPKKSNQMKLIIFLSICLLGFSSLAMGQFEQQFLKQHKADSVKNISILYFNKGEAIDLAIPKAYQQYSFDKWGKKTIHSSFDEKNLLVWQYKYFYDRHDRLVKEIYYNPANGNDTVNYVYDANGQSISYGSGYIASGETTKTEYDADSNMVKITSFVDGGVTSIQRYDYSKKDSKDNWTEMQVYRNDILLYTCARKLVYYNSVPKKK
jgi:YD repeat-containing protein